MYQCVLPPYYELNVTDPWIGKILLGVVGVRTGYDLCEISVKSLSYILNSWHGFLAVLLHTCVSYP